MAGRIKHAERSKRSHKLNNDNRNAGIYRMASVVNRKMAWKNGRAHQRKGEA